eukprot:1491640-Pyramimonas_sp.AAC.1
MVLGRQFSDPRPARRRGDGGMMGACPQGARFRDKSQIRTKADAKRQRRPQVPLAAPSVARGDRPLKGLKDSRQHFQLVFRAAPTRP